jgi:tRNA A37 methylthiotransferase MiaB
VPAEVISRRIDQLMRAQQDVVFARNRRLASAGPAFDVLIDAPAAEGTPGAGSNMEEPSVHAAAGPGRGPLTVRRGEKLYAGRTYQQAPQIDAVTYVASKQKLAPGELVRCRIVGHAGYDLMARPVDETESSTRMTLPILQ